MDIANLLEDIQHSYDGHMTASKIYFNRWIDYGNKKDKEYELLHMGAAHECLKMMEIVNFYKKAV